MYIWDLAGLRVGAGSPFWNVPNGILGTAPVKTRAGEEDSIQEFLLTFEGLLYKLLQRLCFWREVPISMGSNSIMQLGMAGGVRALHLVNFLILLIF